MNAKVRQLVTLLESFDGTAEFLQAVTNAVEHVYAESDSDCPEGFAALDAAVGAFQEVES